MKRSSLLHCAVMLVGAAMLAGCVNNPWREREAKAYYEQQAAILKDRKPLFELKAQPGQTITLSGVESLTVNDPREQRIEALPVHESRFWSTLDKLIGVGASYATTKAVTGGVVDIVKYAASNAGNHSVTNTSISGSYNTQGDTLTNSIRGNVRGDGAGVGNTFVSHDTATTTTGNGNGVGNSGGRDVNVGDQNGNSGRITSPGPYDDHSIPGNQCEGAGCQAPPAADTGD